MLKVLGISALSLLCLALLPAAGCDDDEANWGEVGVVKYLSELGTCWVIEVADESHPYGYKYFEVPNLPSRYRVEGMWVRFEYFVPEEWASICMVGEVIELTRIEELS